MAVTYDNAIKDARMTATRDVVANGTLELLSAGDVVLAIFGLDTDGGTVSSGIWTLVFDSDTVTGESGAGGGTACTKAQIKDDGGTAHITGLTVGMSGTDIVLDNTNIAESQSVTLTSATITHA